MKHEEEISDPLDSIAESATISSVVPAARAEPTERPTTGPTEMPSVRAKKTKYPRPRDSHESLQRAIDR